MMEPEIRTIPPKYLTGMRLHMSLSDQKTRELWQTFMPRRKEITHNLQTGYYSVEVYDPGLDFSTFTPMTVFEKWAAVEVPDATTVPEGMETLKLAGGMYAVFIHHGPASAYQRTFQYIFGVWLPHSGYALDDRAHFEIMGEHYRPDDPEAEEEVWIPVKLKA